MISECQQVLRENRIKVSSYKGASDSKEHGF